MKYYTFFQAMQKLNLTESQLRNLVKTKKIKYRQYKKGYTIYFSENHIEGFKKGYRISGGKWRKQLGSEQKKN